MIDLEISISDKVVWSRCHNLGAEKLRYESIQDTLKRFPGHGSIQSTLSPCRKLPVP
jgi:hypothetical protein